MIGYNPLLNKILAVSNLISDYLIKKCLLLEYPQDGDLQNQARITLIKDKLSTDILSGYGR